MKTLPCEEDERSRMLSVSPIFGPLAPEECGHLARFAMARAYAQGEVLFREGDVADDLIIVVAGRVKLSRFGADGREQVIHVVGAGQPCGEVPVFEGGAFPATAEAIEDVVVVVLPRNAFLEIARANPQVLLSMLAILSRRLRGLVDLVDDLSLKEVSSRLARHLLRLSADAGGSGEIQLDCTKAALASRLGTIAETLSRTFARLQREGLVEVRGRRVVILDAAALKGLSSGRS